MPQTRSKIASNCQILAILVCGLVGLAAGCNECQSGETRCDGNVVKSCSYDGDGPISNATWHESVCPVACREAGGEARCVSAPDPVPECADGHDTCFENTPSSCLGGYPIRHTPCSGDTHCVMSASCGAICVLDDNPDARCAAGPFCDADGNLNACSCDFVIARGTCGGADRCRTMGGISRCTSASTPDARCGDPTQETSGFCSSENVATTCWFGFVAGGINCGSFPCLERPGQSAACELATSSP